MASESREFQVFVKPVGARCNLHCSYCYYLEKQGISRSVPGGFMSDEMLERYIRQHIEASTEPDIFFSWHGGEPTLAGLNFFRKAMTIQEAYMPEGSTVRNGIQTNGTLITDEWGRFFSRENFYVGLSIDGQEGYHNLNRTRADGSGTFEEALRGLEILKQYNVPYEFLCVVSNDNVHAPLEIYRFFRELGAQYITFLPLVEEDGRGSGRATPQSVRPMDFGRFLVTIFDEWIEKDIGRIKVQNFEEALRTAFRQEHTLCIFRVECGGVPVVEMNGDFYMCDHYVDAEHRIGNIADLSLAEMLDHPLQKEFGEHKFRSLPYYCRECEVLDMCNGECPKNRFLKTPDGEPGLNYLCEGYKHFFNYCLPFVDEVARLWKGDR
ncbi:MAG: anaerobic sulfatase maturase [Bacteroidales bacterium]|nr:anaerobic sulfatase maturase [Bacteroidales bacterium]MDT8373859.1 anaerobic sulfatase maturase [Bacteroidales bacterium]